MTRSLLRTGTLMVLVGAALLPGQALAVSSRPHVWVDTIWVQAPNRHVAFDVTRTAGLWSGFVSYDGPSVAFTGTLITMVDDRQLVHFTMDGFGQEYTKDRACEADFTLVATRTKQPHDTLRLSIRPVCAGMPDINAEGAIKNKIQVTGAP